MELYDMLEKKLQSNDIINIVFSFLSYSDHNLLIEKIEKIVYNINVYKSWNIWWNEHRILNNRERKNYNIELHEKVLNDNILEYEKSLFIWKHVIKL